MFQEQQIHIDFYRTLKDDLSKQDSSFIFKIEHANYKKVR